MRSRTLLDIALAGPSFMTYAALRAYARRRLRRGAGLSEVGLQSRAWTLFDTDTMSRPFFVDAVMLVGPRWNTHALIGLTGPFEARHTIRFDAGCADRSARWWTCVLNESGVGQRAALGSHDGLDDEAGWSIEPGHYSLRMRYYDMTPEATLPRVWLDGVLAFSERAVSKADLEAYHSISDFERRRHRLTQHYVYPMLRLRGWLPERLVRAEYLPVGNPQTAFKYGTLEAGDRLQITLPEGLIDDHKVYFTAYNRASFPTAWFPVHNPHHTSAPMPAQGFWLMRIHPKRPHTQRADPETIAVRAL